MAVNIPGIISIVIFYLLILAVGLWAGRVKNRRVTQSGGTASEAQLLAGRNIGLVVGSFTMTATWVGGGYINGTAEAVFLSGLVWVQAPFGYAISLALGGLFFAKQMRDAGYVTMLDPLRIKYGRIMAGLLFIPALTGEVFWSAAILKALGATLTVVLDLDKRISIIVSACIAIFYTFFGGLYSVAYTDVVQLICIFVGLWITVPYALLHPAVTSISVTAASPTNSWYGTLEDRFAGVWVDYALLLIFGGIPWQVYFQRVLSSRSAGRARALSFIAAAGCIFMSIPPILIGAIGASTDWNATSYGGVVPIPDDDKSLILPIVMQHLTPTWAAFVGLGAVSAAVMSSADSSCLSAASLFANNIVREIWIAIAGRELPQVALVWTVRGGIVVVGVLAMALGLSIESIYGLWFLCSDLVYVILFPQLLSSLYVPWANTYGSVVAYIVGCILRFVGGEPLIGLPPAVHYPYYNETDGQLFPFRTLAMLASLTGVVAGSALPHYLFTCRKVALKWDVFRCYRQEADEVKLAGKDNPVFDEPVAAPSVAENEMKFNGEMNLSYRGEEVGENEKKEEEAYVSKMTSL